MLVLAPVPNENPFPIGGKEDALPNDPISEYPVNPAFSPLNPLGRLLVRPALAGRAHDPAIRLVQGTGGSCAMVLMKSREGNRKARSAFIINVECGIESMCVLKVK